MPSARTSSPIVRASTNKIGLCDSPLLNFHSWVVLVQSTCFPRYSKFNQGKVEACCPRCHIIMALRHSRALEKHRAILFSLFLSSSGVSFNSPQEMTLLVQSTNINCIGWVVQNTNIKYTNINYIGRKQQNFLHKVHFEVHSLTYNPIRVRPVTEKNEQILESKFNIFGMY